MPLLNAENVRLTHTGGIHEADLGTPWPTSTAEPLGPAWRGWGYVGNEGIGRALSSSSEPITAMQNGDTVAEIVTEASATYTVPALETRPWIIETIYGTEVDETDGSYTISPAAAKKRKRFVVEMVDNRTMNKTIQMFEATVTEIGDINYTSTDAIILQPTLRVYGDIKVIDDNLRAFPVEETE